ncbi:unnamed protein product [Arctogadus glacialis]
MHIPVAWQHRSKEPKFILQFGFACQVVYIASGIQAICLRSPAPSRFSILAVLLRSPAPPLSSTWVNIPGWISQLSDHIPLNPSS